MSKYSKAIVALGSAVIAVAPAFGLDVDPKAVLAVEGAVSALLVLIVPNAS